jgi:hypothetical protein
MNKKASQLFGLLFFAAVLLVGAKARAQDVFNLADDFSTATNSDTTTWSFRYQANGPLDSNNIPDNTYRNGTYTLMTGDTNFQGNIGLNGWANQTPSGERLQIGDGYTPQMVQNVTGTNYGGGGTLIWPANSVSMYLENSTLTVISWLAPRSGTVNVTYDFVEEWPGNGDQMAWFVDHGDQSGSLASGTISDSDTNTTLQTVTNVAVTAGDRINFLCEPATGTVYNDDYVRVIGRISYSDATNVVYDDEAQFDSTNNTDTNLWSYRYQAYNDGTTNAPDFTDRNGSYTLIPDNWAYYAYSAGLPSFLAGWLRINDYGSLGPEFPDVEQNQTGAVYNYNPYFIIPENQVFMDPDGGAIAVVSWLAPSNGVVSISYEFNMLNDDRYASPDTFNNGVLFYIDKGDFTGNLVSGRLDPDTNDLSFILDTTYNTYPFLLDTGTQIINNVTVNTGDRINFVLDPNGRRLHDCYADSTGISAQIEYLPALTISISGGIVTVTWPGTGTLLQAPVLTGPWTTAGTTSPYTIAASSSQQMFYKLEL